MKWETLDSSTLISLMRRMSAGMSSGASYPNMLLRDRMALNCYNLDIDSSIGMHSVIYVPEDEPDFYDGPVLLEHGAILDLIKLGQKKMKEKRDELHLAPKCAAVETKYRRIDEGIELKISFVLNDVRKVQDTIYKIRVPKGPGKKGKITEKTRNRIVNAGELYREDKVIKIPYVDEYNDTVANILTTYKRMIDRVEKKPCVIDGIKEEIYEKVCESPEIYYYPVTIRGKDVEIPLIKSIFHGLTKLDEFFISVCETNLNDIYLFALYFKSKGIAEHHIGYFLQSKQESDG